MLALLSPHQLDFDLPINGYYIRAMARDSKTTPRSTYTDTELHDWLRWADEHGSSFLRAIAEAAFVADLKHYSLLRPVLLELMKELPKPA
jgi:hypothetical protein